MKRTEAVIGNKVIKRNIQRNIAQHFVKSMDPCGHRWTLRTAFPSLGTPGEGEGGGFFCLMSIDEANPHLNPPSVYQGRR